MPTESAMFDQFCARRRSESCECNCRENQKQLLKDEQTSSHLNCIKQHFVICSKTAKISFHECHEHSWLSRNSHRTYASFVLNVLSRFKLRKNNSTNFRIRSYLFHPSFVFYVFLFFTLFFVSNSDAASVGQTQNNNISLNNRTREKTIIQSKLNNPIPMVESGLDNTLKPNLTQPTFKVKRASKVFKWNPRRKSSSSKRREHKREKNEKKSKRRRRKKKPKITSTPFPHDLIQHHGNIQHNLNQVGAQTKEVLTVSIILVNEIIWNCFAMAYELTAGRDCLRLKCKVCPI